MSHWNEQLNEKCGCNHCWHQKRGPIWMVVPDGHTVQECCKCHACRTIHVDHMLDDHRRGSRWSMSQGR